ncbi:unannotated protein [freshwater metagenome]|uniref:Sensor histidine kinase MtrB n=1 Tax=freshwater metagenome TaxID=449393 RepID=A0A6J7XQE9_9ZZZZ|nr:HAMP domain-containing protein [Actinomycetota bacterium]
MRSLSSRLRNSLAARVLVSTVLLSMSVVWLSSSALDSRLSEGVKKVNLDSSINEARSTIVGAIYRLALANVNPKIEVKKIIDDVVVSVRTAGTSGSGREIAILKAPTSIKNDLNYQTTSNFVDPLSIPQEFRSKIRANKELQWKYITMQYAGNVQVPAIAVGQLIKVPRAGSYEIYLLFPLTNQNKTLDLITNSILFTGIALVLLISLITWLLARQVIRPVREAARIAGEFTAGDLDKRMQVNSKDEIAALGNSFNEMAQSIQEQISRLENLSRVQQRFVSDVSHELRTPLTTLRMASGVIYEARATFDPQIARSAELLVAQIDRFERLLEDLLEVSRFDAEVALLEITDFNVVNAVKRCIADLVLVAREESTTISLFANEDEIMLKGDVRRIERILRNLLTNAIDHAEAKPIEVVIISDDHDVAISVRDFGGGLDESSLTRVFDRFWREDPSRSREHGGTGLGLSIALEDARLHNGELEAWGRPGMGAHFVLTLPLVAGDQIESRIISLTPSSLPR